MAFLQAVSVKNIARSIFILTILIAIILLFPPYSAQSSSDENINGWAWSENVGWISFNNTTGGGGIDYGVKVDLATGVFSGHAWSENIGWISFDRSETGTPPLSPYTGGETYIAKLDLTTFQVSGWARAMLYGEGWDGWIKFAGTAQDGSGYGVIVDQDSGEFTGWAFGGDVVGWIGLNCANTNSCPTVSYNVKSPFAPVAHWKFDEGAGGNAADSSGHNLTAGLTGVQWQPEAGCKFGKCIGTDSDGDSITTSSSALFDIGSGLTYSTWVKFGSAYTPSGGARSPRVMTNNGGDTHKGYGLRYEIPGGSIGNAGNLYFEWGQAPCDGSSYTNISLGPNLLDDDWHFAAATYDGSELKVYLDGDLSGQSSVSGLCSLGTNAMLLSERAAGTPNVFLDEAKVYSYPRSAVQIRKEYQYLILNYEFDDWVSGDSQTVIDTSGNGMHGLTHYGANAGGMSCAVLGKVAGACQFDGVDDYVTAGASIYVNQTQEAWIRPSSTTGDRRITSRGSCGNGRLYIVNGKVRWEFGSNTTCQRIESDATLLPNEWYHIAATNHNGALKIYINGVLDKTGNYTITPIISAPITIGSHEGTATFFSGLIDDVSVYAIARSADQIKQDYEGRVAYFKLNEGAGAVINDSSLFSNTASGAGTDAEDWDVGRLSYALDFDSADNEYAEVASPLGVKGMKAGTLSAWVYKKGGYTSYQSPLSLVNVTRGYMFDLDVFNADGRFYSHLCSTINCGGVANELISDTPVPLNEWTHLAATYDGASQILYMNGKEVARRSHAAWLDFAPGDDIRIRLGRNTGDYFNGAVDEVKISSRSLNVAEIVADYRSGFSPSLHFKLDDAVSGDGQTITDSSVESNNGLTENDVSCGASGVLGSACVFDGASDYIAVPAEQSLNIGGGFTVSAWVNSTGAGREGIVVNGGTIGSDTNTSYIFYIDGVGNLGKAHGRISNGISTESVIGTTQGLADGAWHHIAFTSDGSFLKIYVDGALENTENQTITRQVDPLFVTYIGTNTRDVSGWSFDGLLDDVKIYQYARTASQIQSDYDRSVGSWKFDEAIGEIAVDSSGNGRNAIITAASWRDEDLCYDGKCLFYDGGGDNAEVVIDSDVAINGALSALAWIYPIGVSSSPDAGIMGTGISGGYELTYHTDGNVYFYIGNGTNNISAFAAPDRWHQVAGVWDGTTDPEGMKLYIDGALAKTGASSLSSIAPSRNLFFGKETSDFNGFIDEAKLYSRALSAAEIAADFGGGAGTLALRLKMDDNVSGNGKTITDVSGNGNNGITVWGGNAAGMDCTGSGKQGSACAFDGADDYISVPDAPSLNPAVFTITSWVYWNGGGDSLQNIVSKMNYPTEGYRLLYYNDGKARFSVGNGGGEIYVETASGALSPDRWTHFGAVYDGVSLSLYLDGVPAGSFPMSGTLASAARPFRVGSYNGAEEYLNGLLDEVRLYSYALTAEQMKEDYQKGFAPVSHWKMDDGSGVIARDESENKNDGELFGPVWRSGDDCAFADCLSFDGVNDYVDAGDDQSLKISKALTIEAWISPAAVPSGNDSGIMGTGFPGYALTYNNDGKVWFYIDGAGNNVKSDFPLDGFWHHVAGVWDGTTGPQGMKLYIDGKLKEKDASTSSSISGWQNFTIGNATTKFNGFIDDTRVYNYARSDYEILLDYAAMFPLHAPFNVRNPAGPEYNTLNSIIFHWDPTPLATTYYVYVLKPNLQWDRAGITNTASFILTTNNPGTGAPLVPDTSYNIKVVAVDDVGQSTASAFSDIAIAATSANAPVNVSGVDAPTVGGDQGEVVWSWEGGGRDSGSYAELASDPEINSGWMPLRFSDGTFTRAFGYRPFSGVTNIMAQKGILISQYDNLQYSYGSKLLDGVRENFNPKEGTIEAWIRPRWNGNDTKHHTLFDGGSANLPLIEKTPDGNWRFSWIGTGDLVATPATHTAGDFVYIVASWDVNTTLDGTNHARLTINNTNAYGAPSPLTFGIPGENFILGNNTDRTASIDSLVSVRILGRALSAADVVVLYAGGAGSASSFAVDADTIWLSDFTNSATQAKYVHQGQGVVLSTSSSVTFEEEVGLRVWEDNAAVDVYDGTAYRVSAFVNGAPTSSSTDISLDDGSSGAVPALEHVGGMLSFNGQTDYALFGNEPELNMGTSDWTIMAWVRTTETSGTGVIFGKKQSGGIDEGYRLAIKDGRVLASIGSGTAAYSASDGVTVNDGLWHHVVSVFDRNGNITRYVDRNLVGTTVSIAALDGVDISNSFQAALGSSGLLGNELFTGDIAEVQVFGKELDAAKVNLLFNNPKKDLAGVKTLLGFTDADIRGLWQLYKKTPPIVTDLSVNSNDGAITGATYRKEAVAKKIAGGTDRAEPVIAEPSTLAQSGITDLDPRIVPHEELSITSITDGVAFDTITTSPGSVSAFQVLDPVDVSDGTGYKVSGFIKDILSDTAVTVDDGALADIDAETVGWYASYNGTEMAQIGADSNALDIGTGNVSISAWIKTTDATGDGSNRIVSKMTANVGYEIYYNDITGKIGIAIGDDNGNISGGTVGAKNVRGGAWHHVAVVFDRGDKATVYIDGVLDGELKIAPEDADGTSLPVGSASNAAKLTIGADSDGKRNFTGDIRDVRIWVGGLWSDSDIAAQKANPLNPLDASTGGNTEYWLMNGSSNKTVAAGIVPGTHDLTLTNFNEWKQTAFIIRTNLGARPNDTVIRERRGILIDGEDTLTFPAKNTISNIEGTIGIRVRFPVPGSLIGPNFSPTLIDITSGNSQIYLGHDEVNFGTPSNITFWIKDSSGVKTILGAADVSLWEANKWYQFVLQWDTKQFADFGQLLLDGHVVPPGAVPLNGDLNDFSNADIFIGTRADGTHQADAYIDEIYALNYWFHSITPEFSNQEHLRKWTMRNAPCGTPFTARVASTNRDGDQTTFVEGFADPFACTKICETGSDCGGGEVCSLTGTYKQCLPEKECIDISWCNKFYNGSDRDGFCRGLSPDDDDNVCDVYPEAKILVKSIDHANRTVSVSAELSTDDLTPVGVLQVRWDFDYKEGEPGEPNWGNAGNYNYTKKASDTLSHAYLVDGTYKIALQIRDAVGAMGMGPGIGESTIVVQPVSIVQGGGKIVAISPVAFPATNALYAYDAGIIEINKTKDISLLLCNLGTQSLNVAGLALAGGTKFSHLCSGVPCPTSFVLSPDTSGPSPECTTNNDSLSRKFVTIRFAPGGDAGFFTSAFRITTDGENDVTGSGAGIIDISLRGQALTVMLGSDVPVEDVIYTGRTIINPPPGFGEFLEKLRFVEPAKPR